MEIRFKIHDRAIYPDGAVLDVPEPSDMLREALSDGVDGIPVAGITLRTPRGIGYGNIWLTEPTLEALDVELTRLAGIRDTLIAKREAYVAKRKAG